MLCEIHTLGGNFFITWALLSVLGGAAILFFSGVVFRAYYAAPDFAQWQRKLNPAYPSPAKVRSEILATLKGLVCATLCPSLSLYLAQHGMARGFCGSGGYSAAYHVGCFALIWLASDIYEWAYHVFGHAQLSLGWQNHKSHHRFWNPSPFSVIADDAVDQLVRSAPLLLFPLIMPINVDLLFAVYALFFYVYGVALHWGFESEHLSAHQAIINGPFEHYYHHAYATAGAPIYCGFFFKAWDALLGSVPPAGAPCKCSRCEVLRGNRTRAKFDALVMPDYGLLLRPSFWLAALTTEPSAADKAE